MNYKVLEFDEPEPEKQEILIAFLAEAGFEMFEETDSGIKAFVEESSYDENKLDELVISRFSAISFSVSQIPRENWNEVWEKNFEPMQVGEVYIRAPFHPKKEGVKYELIIEPKMSFGTGHHATTTLMIREMLKTDFSDKKVLDMGCGTSLLAILASKRGAAEIVAVDIDDWAVENSRENCVRNSIENITVMKGDAGTIKGLHFDIILANINRNVLLDDMQAYSESLVPGGEIILSGFYENDMDAILQCAGKFGFTQMSSEILNQWVVMHFAKMA